MTERGDAQSCHSATWGRLTDRFRSLGRVCCLTTALLQFNPQVSMQCLEPSDVGLPVDGQSGGLPLSLKPPGSRQHLLQGISHISAWLDFVSSQWLHLLLDGGTAPARRVTSLTFLKSPYQIISFLNPGPSFNVSSCNYRIWTTGPLSGLSKASPFGNGFGNRHWFGPKDIVCVAAA